MPNSHKLWEIEAYPKLLSEIRAALGPEKLISAAVPGLPRDMMAFTNKTIPKISSSLDFFNVMTYDMMNRRDCITKHHTGIELSVQAVNAYIENGVPPGKVSLGLAFYVKWFRTDPGADCSSKPLGCRTVLMEDPETGKDLGQCGAFAWSDEVPIELSVSFERALEGGRYDRKHGGYYFWDAEEHLWWTWDSPEVIDDKFPVIIDQRDLGGVFAWGLGEDGDKWAHLKAMAAGVRRQLQLDGLGNQNARHQRLITEGTEGVAAGQVPGPVHKGEL